jgi:two-component system response regulator HydG
MDPRSPRILVVDDDVDACENLRDIFTEQGYRVDTAHDGPAALRLVDRHVYDVALLDLRMPGMDGLTLYREIRRRSAGTVAMIVTAYAGGTTREEALAAGAWEVLAKPVDLGQLLGRIGTILDRPVILIVDDDRDLCANLWDVLKERCYRVFLAHDPAEAADRLREGSFQVALIDMKLPGGDGGSVFERVRAASPQTRTILITGYRPETDSLIERALAAGADLACNKPFDVPALLEAVEQLTRREPARGR